MARIAGVDIPDNKRLEISLTYIFGIGKNSSQKILKKVSIDKNTKAKDLDNQSLDKIREEIQNYTIEGDLRRNTSMNIKRLMDLGNYRGLRHRRGLPVHGQRTKTNARTRKGPNRAIVGKKKK